MPKGYLIAELEVTNPAGYEEYRHEVPAVLAAYGARYIVRGGNATQLEGPGVLPAAWLLSSSTASSG
jgi:uncharacterized protein (DUF1330 family)